MKIRKAKLSDAEELAKLKYEIWKTTYTGIYPQERFDNYDIAERTGRFERDIRDNQFYVAEDKGRIVGFTCFGRLPDDANFRYKDCEHGLCQLYIRKEYQRCGLGRLFFEKCVGYFKSIGVVAFTIRCNKHNTNACKFYEKMGAELLEVDGQKESKDLEQASFVFIIKEEA